MAGIYDAGQPPQGGGLLGLLSQILGGQQSQGVLGGSQPQMPNAGMMQGALAPGLDATHMRYPGDDPIAELSAQRMNRADPMAFAMGFMGGPRAGMRPYQTAPDSLMGFRRNGPQAAFEEGNYQHIQPVEVTLNGGDKFVDAIKGLNQPHAIERAYRNWDASNIRPISQDEYMKMIAAEGQK